MSWRGAIAAIALALVCALAWAFLQFVVAACTAPFVMVQ